MTVWLQLAFGTWLVLWPGRVVARALGVAGLAEGLTWSLGLVAAALAVTVAVHGSLWLAFALVLAAGVAALPFAWRRDGGVTHPALVLAGLALGGAVWWLEGIVGGDGLFHLGRLRKLGDLGSLTLRSVDEFKNGGLHPGYAFPLWHAWLALVGRATGLDPTQVVLHESSLLVPLALVLAFEMGRVVFRSSALGVATMLAQVGIIALAPGNGGAYRTLELPGTTARQLLVPAALVVFFRFVRAPSWPLAATVAVVAMSLSFVHPTYALFLVIVLGGYGLARLVLVRELRVNVLALASSVVPMTLVFLWLKPIVDETVSRSAVAQGLQQYRTDLVVHSQTSYHLAAGVVTRTGSIAIAALALAPLAVLATRRRWAALVLGGTVVVLGIELSSFLFPHFSHLVSLSQSRRAAGFVPFAFAFAGGLAVLPAVLAVPGAIAGGIVLQQQWPGDFGLRLAHGGPPGVAWWALFGCLAAVAIGAVRRFDRTRRAGLAAAIFVLPVAVHGLGRWNAGSTHDPYALTPGLVRFLRSGVPKGGVVYAGLQTSYRVGAYAPVYVCNGPPTHVADTRANAPYARADAAARFFATHDLAIPRSCGAGWIVLRREQRMQLPLPVVYRDRMFRVLRLQSAP